ncbi:MAG: lysine--tRNA ligase [Candidatus Altiarchaeota archaeon]
MEKNLDELIKERERKYQEILSSGVYPHGKKFERSSSIFGIIEKFSKIEAGEKLDSEKVKIAGRIRSIREHGKLIFYDIEDFTARIQVVFDVKFLGEKNFKFLEKFNVGDFIGIEGFIGKTKIGELSVWAERYELLNKALRPLPHEWYGLKDVEVRYRERYLDLIMNPKVREIFIKRALIIKAMREFLENNGYIEVNTPVLQPIYGGALAKPFTTYHNELKRTLYLRISPELYLKRAIVGGFEKVYEITVNFRNEGIDTKHNPEFTMLETMWAYANYEDNMKFCEEMIEYIAKRVLQKTKITYQEKEINLKAPFKRITMYDAIKEYLNINVEKESDANLRKFLIEKNLKVPSYASRGYLISEIFNLVEGKIEQPTFITDFPVEVSPLAKTKAENPQLTERFELIILGQEYANSYSEENNPKEQRRKLQEQAKLRKKGSEEAHMMDEDFIKALEYGMPPTSGLGIGVDRLVMLLTDSASIREVIMFPILKEEK